MQYPIAHVSQQQAYLKLFSRAGEYKAVGDASTSYLWDPAAPSRIHAANPQAKIVIVLRDPVERAHSHYLMDVREGWQHSSFYDALRQDWQRTEKGYGISRLYVELGLYHQQVKRYLDAFGRDRVQILFSRNLDGPPINGKSHMLAEVIDFLGLDSTCLSRIDASRRENAFGVTRWHWASRVAGSRWARRLGQILVPARLGSTYRIKRTVFEPFFVKRTERPSIPADARDWLVSLYKENVCELEGLLGRSLPELRSSW